MNLVFYNQNKEIIRVELDSTLTMYPISYSQIQCETGQGFKFVIANGPEYGRFVYQLPNVENYIGFLEVATGLFRLSSVKDNQIRSEDFARTGLKIIPQSSQSHIWSK